MNQQGDVGGGTMPLVGACETASADRGSEKALTGWVARSRRAMRVFATVGWFELRMTARSRWTLVMAAVFLLAGAGLSYFGMFGAGYLDFQGFERTAVSLLSLTLYVAPLLGLVAGLESFSGGDGTDLLFASREGRTWIVLGKLAGTTLAVAAALLVGFGGAGLLIASRTGSDGAVGYATVVGSAIGLSAAFAGMAAAAVFAHRDRLQASGTAVGAWLWFVLLYELVVLGLMLLVPDAVAGRWVVAAVFGSPVSLARVASLVALDAQPVLGASGALLLRTLGHDQVIIVLLAALAAWVIVSWGSAAILASRRDAS